MAADVKISIVTPSFNSGEYIRETLESVLSQEYENYEYLVMDGGSTDQTSNILKEFSQDPRARHKFSWISEKDRGQTDAINKGLRMASGEWFAFLNADDFYEPGIFRKLIPYFEQYRDKGVIYGNCYVVFEGDKQRDKNMLVPPHKIDFQRMNKGNAIYGPASFYNMAALKKVGEFDDSLYHWMDYDMYLRISQVMELQYIDLPLTNFRVTAGQKSPFTPHRARAYKKFHREAHDVWRKNGGHYFTRLWWRRSLALGWLAYFFNRITGKAPLGL